MLMPTLRCTLFWTLLLGLVLSWHTSSTQAQDFRIYTRVFDEGAKLQNPNSNKPAPIVARSLSLFHAGKVYDYIDSVGEVIIFEPVHHRFTILSTSRSLVTTVDFDELRQVLKVARHETEKYIEQLKQQETEQAAAALLDFQLNPKFEAKWEANTNLLTLDGSQIRYTVRCAEGKSDEIVNNYLRYADWMSRLNYALHPQAMYPEARLKLNVSLRELKRLPIEVHLQAQAKTNVPLHLRAQHQIHWQLDSKDRSLIHYWETLLQNEQTQRVTFREYQRAILVSQTKK